MERMEIEEKVFILQRDENGNEFIQDSMYDIELTSGGTRGGSDRNWAMSSCKSVRKSNRDTLRVREVVRGYCVRVSTVSEFLRDKGGV